MIGFSFILPVLALLLTVFVIEWSIKRTQNINSAEYYIGLFTENAKFILSDSSFPSHAKEVLIFVGASIDDAKFARILCQIISSPEFHDREKARQYSPSILADIANENLIRRFCMALFYAYFALSYRDGRNGWRVRRWLTSMLPSATYEGRSYFAVAEKVYQASENRLAAA